ncbi:MAG: hypothetical protein ACOYXT_05530 [Bacteroidota bacterium]
MNIWGILKNSLSELDRVLTDKMITDDLHGFLFTDTDEVLVVVDLKNDSTMMKLTNVDQVFVLNRYISYGHAEVARVPLTVNVAIGNCTIEYGICQVSKCCADLLYNDDLELVSVDFYLDENMQNSDV